MIICGTGHRPDKLGGYGKDAADKCVDLAIDYLKNQRPDVVISGMALGWDQALAIATLLENIELWAYIPFEGQEKVWPAQSKNLYKYILDRTSHIHIVCPGHYAPWKMQERNKAMVDNADLVLALWNGSSGGTKNCIDYAESKKKPVLNLWPQYEAMEIETHDHEVS